MASAFLFVFPPLLTAPRSFPNHRPSLCVPLLLLLFNIYNMYLSTPASISQTTSAPLYHHLLYARSAHSLPVYTFATLRINSNSFLRISVALGPFDSALIRFKGTATSTSSSQITSYRFLHSPIRLLHPASQFYLTCHQYSPEREPTFQSHTLTVLVSDSI